MNLSPQGKISIDVRVSKYVNSGSHFLMTLLKEFNFLFIIAITPDIRTSTVETFVQPSYAYPPLFDFYGRVISLLVFMVT